MSDSTLRRRPAAAVAGAAILLFAIVSGLPARATVRPLDERELASVRGADGSLGLALGSGNASASNDLSQKLGTAFGSSKSATLDAAAFETALQAAGWPAGTAMPGYDGQPVLQLHVDAPPSDFSMPLSSLLLLGGSQDYQGGSMGTISVNRFDARGTTFWVWHHP